MRENASENQLLLAREHSSSLQIGFFFKKVATRLYHDIFTAAERGDIALLNKLIAYGADINKKDRCSKTALFYAVLHGHLNCVRLLLEKGANPNIPCRKRPLSGFIAANQTPLHFAVLLNNQGAVELLLEYNADVTLRDSQGYTPKMIADRLYYRDLSQLFAIREGIIATESSEPQGDTMWAGFGTSMF